MNMQELPYEPTDLNNFFVTGINYRKTDASIRGQFAISEEQYQSLLERSEIYGISEFFIVSTCNRTEIYGFARSSKQLAQFLCSQTSGPLSVFYNLSYAKNGLDAVEHLFRVGAGLDSQILGDYEIVGQIKQSAKFAKKFGRIGSFTERLLNGVLQCSKAIKNNTCLSEGTVSVGFAAVQYIRENVSALPEKNILIIGTGKMGAIISRNLKDYLEPGLITLINRTDEKAALLAAQLQLKAASIKDLEEEIHKADIIFVATNAPGYVITKHHLQKGGKLILDLSIPHNVDPDCASLNNMRLVNVDELSKMKDATLARRMADVPRAVGIIKEHMSEFESWFGMRRHIPVLKAVKSKLHEIRSSPLFLTSYDLSDTPSADKKIQRVINGMATRLKGQDQKGCYYIQAINEFMETGTHG
jgi:glutamyl-tRNA reductase